MVGNFWRSAIDLLLLLYSARFNVHKSEENGGNPKLKSFAPSFLIAHAAY
jgi:hypothetical protein